MKLEREFFELVKSGEKTCEGRFGVRDLDVGDEIMFECDDDKLTVIVLEINFYPSIEKMLEFHLNELLPGYNVDNAIAVYNRIYGEKIKKAMENREIITMTVIKFKLV